jgi:hypothetical protein
MHFALEERYMRRHDDPLAAAGMIMNACLTKSTIFRTISLMKRRPPALLPGGSKHGFHVISRRTTRVYTGRWALTRTNLSEPFACRFTDGIEQIKIASRRTP